MLGASQIVYSSILMHPNLGPTKVDAVQDINPAFHKITFGYSIPLFTQSVMPLYQIYHTVPLSNEQQDELAEAITTLHTTKFGVLRHFVNVWFSDISTQSTYIAGRRHKGNHIRASVRLGHRTQEDFRHLCQSIEEAWNRIVCLPVKRGTVNATERKQSELHTLILGPSNPMGREAGFELPVAGHDGDWLRQNWNQFQQKAKDGDAEFVELLEDVEKRGLLFNK